MKRDEDGVRRWHELIEWIPVRDEIDETDEHHLFCFAIQYYFV